jgi:hypothetical protein
MAKKTKSKKTNGAPAPKKTTPVVCFFFYGSIDELGDQLAIFAQKSDIAGAVTSFVEAAKAAGVTVK